jgi:hypothetical protein
MLEQDSVLRLLTTVLVCRVGCRKEMLGLGMLLVRTEKMSVKYRQPLKTRCEMCTEPGWMKKTQLEIDC